MVRSQFSEAVAPSPCSSTTVGADGRGPVASRTYVRPRPASSTNRPRTGVNGVTVPLSSPSRSVTGHTYPTAMRPYQRVVCYGYHAKG
jgi:hypothetical protein